MKKVWRIENEQNVFYFEDITNIPNAIDMILEMEVGDKFTFHCVEITQKEWNEMV